MACDIVEPVGNFTNIGSFYYLILIVKENWFMEALSQSNLKDLKNKKYNFRGNSIFEQ